MRKRSTISALLVITMVAAACAGDDAETTTTTDASTTAVPEETSTTEAAASGMDTLRGATVRIVANGTFVDPAEGEQANVAGSGSGFIIDESGLAVTNNHVVTGAAFVDVYLDGEDDPVNARILGVSECNDLAVIDLDGDGYPFLEWYEGAIEVGLDVFAAGFPLGTDEYTLLDGIVSKEDAGGETSWASVDAVIEHSADTLPGNSGGPIVTTDGAVVAVNYAGNRANQSFAIGREIARPAIEVLAGGDDLETIGINGEAFVTDSLSGVWVSSVASGSAADDVGVEAGDIITRLENLVLATDGTMSDYCDILRSNDADAVMAIEVYRPATDEVLEGRLNGDPLVQVFSFAGEVEDVVEDPPANDGAAAYSAYTLVTDDTGSISVEVPVEWADTLGVSWEFQGELVGPALGAAPDYAAWQSGWTTPGVFIAASPVVSLGIEEMLDLSEFSNTCTYVDRVDYDDGLYAGFMDIYEDCGGTTASFLVIAALPPDAGFITLVQLVIVSDRDWDAADQVVRTFNVVDPQVP
jgi:serine protease Do